MKLCVNHETNEFYSHPVDDGTKCPLCNKPAWLCLMPSDEAGLEFCDYRFCESPTCEWENI